MTGKTAFETQYGFARKDVRLETWRLSPFNRWSFQNVGELVPSVHVAAAPGGEGQAKSVGTLLEEKVSFAGGSETVGSFLKRSDTDGLTILKGGKLVGDWSAPHMPFGARHIIFSISKSVTAILAGILQGEGLFDPNAPVTHYIPEAKSSAYSDASVRNVLDMTVSLDFEEAYLDPQSAFARYRRSTLWNPGGGSESLAAFLLTLQRLAEPHGQTYRYRSPNSDMLGILVERASGKRVSQLLSEKLWLPLGAASEISVTVDMEGTARTAGGMSMTPRDLARIGEMMRQGGTANGRRIVPEAWVRDTVATGGSFEAWQRGTMAFLFPKGRYRNKWYQTGHDSGAFCGIGIHGQWLYVNPKTEVVIAKMSSQPEPVDDRLDLDLVSFFEALSTMV
ncbi:class C beta-lactamase-related serine hydrolase [Mesorhizobium sp. M2A.F.Ca.ET.037.01.1.1]|uniref:serine hydrolase domain-containing protein n=1 Tax=unclassified Mesorhizobium TaxID=325217 RepID=UPI000F75C680|nr:MULTISPECIES: serine hydrolase [unclassified Mesorhizobium]RUY11690.1 class C beta-lactamase-related serine hydrolase [Mesorhizobium sp. M2A.F.Ca.ET.040.01.1.1]RVC69726.1 class C beta-lactamase-related serine hydrolase [Mesorhizobium sp. M00.F.Ca.ET.038.03.1.1]RVC73661.1 class C beta-lactamase-related serine hydrolase [Mesorhizobium sp. M2A.F.Ca.ET.046.02.1.1]AZO37086.1 class C beta-lactamase-related serine hydrolase [Mesorhizobium sp. M2A.F.Ca.ET.046.03.2.1]RUX15390.1 class C beta-lactamas